MNLVGIFSGDGADIVFISLSSVIYILQFQVVINYIFNHFLKKKVFLFYLILNWKYNEKCQQKFGKKNIVLDLSLVNENY